jgi:hypothetical protein
MGVKVCPDIVDRHRRGESMLSRQCERFSRHRSTAGRLCVECGHTLTSRP